MSKSLLYYQRFSINYQNEKNLISLTDLFNAQSFSDELKPFLWMRTDPVQKLLKHLAVENCIPPIWSNTDIDNQTFLSTIIELPGFIEMSRDGENVNIYARPSLAIAYAKFISDDCYRWILTIFEEDAKEGIDYIKQLEQEKQEKNLSRRTLIAAGWSVPIIATLTINRKLAAQTSGRGGFPTPTEEDKEGGGGRQREELNESEKSFEEEMREPGFDPEEGEETMEKSQEEQTENEERKTEMGIN